MKRIIIYTLTVACCGVIAYAAAKQLSSRQSADINAPASKVWTILVDPNTWAEDNPAVKKAKLISGNGEAVGSVVEFYPVVGKKSIKATLTVKVSEKLKKLEFDVKLLGATAIMGFELTEQDGKCTLVNYETATGAMVNMISQEDMDWEHKEWVQSVKRRAEKP